MIFSLILMWTAAAMKPAPAMPASPPVATCFECTTPNCPISFWVCNESSTHTTIASKKGKANRRATVLKASSARLPTTGPIIYPTAGKTWGTVASCSDIYYEC